MAASVIAGRNGKPLSLMLYELCHIGHAPAYVTMMIIGCDIMTLSLGICSAVIGELVQ